MVEVVERMEEADEDEVARENVGRMKDGRVGVIDGEDIFVVGLLGW